MPTARPTRAARRMSEVGFGLMGLEGGNELATCTAALVGLWVCSA